MKILSHFFYAGVVWLNLMARVSGEPGPLSLDEILQDLKHHAQTVAADVSTWAVGFWEGASALGHHAQEYAGHILSEEASRFEDGIATQIYSIQDTFGNILAGVDGLKVGLAAAFEAQQVPLALAGSQPAVVHPNESIGHSDEDGGLLGTFEQSLAKLSTMIESVLGEVVEDPRLVFPPASGYAANHAERKGNISLILTRVEDVIVQLCVDFGMEGDAVRMHLDDILPHIEDVVLTIGNLVEQHPCLAETLIVAGTLLVIPEGWFLRPVLSLIGFGPKGVQKGTFASLVQSTFFGPIIPKGSWFSHLQRVAMTAAASPLTDKLLGGLAVVGITTTFISNCVSN